VTENHSSTNNRKIIYLTPDMLRRNTNTVHSQESTEMSQNDFPQADSRDASKTLTTLFDTWLTDAQNRHCVLSRTFQRQEELSFYRLLQNELPGTKQVLDQLMAMVDELDFQLKGLAGQLHDFIASLRQQNGKVLHLSGDQAPLNVIPEFETMAGDILQVEEPMGESEEKISKVAVQRMAQQELQGTQRSLGTIHVLVDALDWQIKDLTATFENFVEEMNQASGG
jgi:hypothetical protein